MIPWLPLPLTGQVSAFAGPGIEAKGFGPVPDVDTLCRWAAQGWRGAALVAAALCHIATVLTRQC